jgi:hypothetical protein
MPLQEEASVKMMSSYESDDFVVLQKMLARDLSQGEVVNVGEWQSVRDPNAPQSTTIELQDVHLRIPIPPSVEGLQDFVNPTLPWAEDHFLERVSGEPLNPPPSASYWNKDKEAVDVHRTINEGGTLKYSHTYPERFWPKYARYYTFRDEDGVLREGIGTHLRGIRFRYGDLADVVSLLAKSPLTRQAFLPVWFPEDTGAVHGERVPCTLGYHFLLRGGRLNVYYFIRSCDFFRHFANDVYLAARLCQWMVQAVSNWYPDYDAIPHPLWRGDVPHNRSHNLYSYAKPQPGNLIMQISSLHVFEAERKRLDRHTS